MSKPKDLYQISSFIGEHVPVIIIGLAKKIGLNESLMLAQLSFLIGCSNTQKKNGKWWAYESITDLGKEFPFWSRSTINRAIKELEKQGLIFVENFNKFKYDKTRWFALNYEAIAALKCVSLCNEDGESWVSETRSSQNETGKNQNDTRSVQNGTTIPDPHADPHADPLLKEAGEKNPPAPPVETLNPQATSVHSGEGKELTTPSAESEREKETVPVERKVIAPPAETIASILGQPEPEDKPKVYGDPVAHGMKIGREREGKLDYVYLEAIKAFCELSPYFDYEVVSKDTKMLQNWNGSKAFGGHAKVHGLSPDELARGIRNISPEEYGWEIKNPWKNGPYSDLLGYVAAMKRHEPERGNAVVMPT